MIIFVLDPHNAQGLRLNPWFRFYSEMQQKNQGIYSLGDFSFQSFTWHCPSYFWSTVEKRNSPGIVHHRRDQDWRKLVLWCTWDTSDWQHQHIHKNEKIAQFGWILSLSCLLGFVQNSPRLLCQRKEEFWLGHIFVAILLETANSFVFLSKTVCSVCNNKFPG